MLTLEDVKNRVIEIEQCKGDDERAHGKEDELYEDVLAAISEGTCEDPMKCAKEALKTCDIDFSRWCA